MTSRSDSSTIERSARAPVFRSRATSAAACSAPGVNASSTLSSDRNFSNCRVTAFFGSVVLLGHYHYSIDVLAALFITHGVFQASCWLFARDYALFRSSENLAAPRQKRTNRKTSIPAGGRRRTLEPFTLHVVGNDDPAPSG
jgi:hypothetical protein